MPVVTVPCQAQRRPDRHHRLTDAQIRRRPEGDRRQAGNALHPNDCDVGGGVRADTVNSAVRPSEKVTVVFGGRWGAPRCPDPGGCAFGRRRVRRTGGAPGLAAVATTWLLVRIRPSADRTMPEPSSDARPRLVSSMTTLGTTLAATCSTLPTARSRPACRGWSLPLRRRRRTQAFRGRAMTDAAAPGPYRPRRQRPLPGADRLCACAGRSRRGWRPGAGGAPRWPPCPANGPKGGRCCWLGWWLERDPQPGGTSSPLP